MHTYYKTTTLRIRMQQIEIYVLSNNKLNGIEIADLLLNNNFSKFGVQRIEIYILSNNKCIF